MTSSLEKFADKIEFQSVYNDGLIIVKNEEEKQDLFAERMDWYEYHLISPKITSKIEIFRKQKVNTIFILLPHLFFEKFDEGQISWIFASAIRAFGDYIYDREFNFEAIAISVQGNQYNNSESYKTLVTELINDCKQEIETQFEDDYDFELVSRDIVWHNTLQWIGFSIEQIENKNWLQERYNNVYRGRIERHNRSPWENMIDRG